MNYRVLDIVRGTTVDGPGFRTSIYLAGCTHQCPGCHNPQSWDPNAGEEYTLQKILDIVKEEDFNVTLTGGDPLFNPQSAKTLVDAITALGYTVWLYTGYTWEAIQRDPQRMAVLENVEAIVEGPFIQALRDVTLRFRGSSNQRIIYPHQN
jgi:anaerobic ribonucleoside-triphosphate reductase activating protein